MSQEAEGSTMSINEVREALQARVASGASWFYWIAGLSLINYGIYAFGGNTRFVVGLGISDVLTALITSTAIAVLANLIVSGIFIGFGLLSVQGKSWSLIIGMILYACDGLLFLIVQDYMSIAFHVLALYYLFQGLQALRALNNLPQESIPQYVPPTDDSVHESV